MSLDLQLSKRLESKTVCRSIIASLGRDFNLGWNILIEQIDVSQKLFLVFRIIQ